MTGVDLIPVGEFPGKPVYCPLGGHERLTAPFRIAHVAQQPQPEVVERHIAQVRAGIGEAHLNAVVASQLLEHLGAMIGDGGPPAQRGAVLDDEIQKGIHRMQPAAVQTHLPE